MIVIIPQAGLSNILRAFSLRTLRKILPSPDKK